MNISNKNYYLLLTIIFVVAFAIRVGMTIQFQGLDSPPDFNAQPDQIDYELLAFHLSTGQGYSISGEPSAYRPPGTSFALLPIYALSGRSFAIGRLWFCFLSALTCVATAWTIKQCYSTLAAIVAAIWLAIYPGHFYYAMHFVSEVPGSLWITLACGFTLRSIMNGGSHADVIAGIFWGLATLTRPQVIFTPLIAWTVTLFLPKAVQHRILRHVAVQTCIFAILLAPWIIRNSMVMGKATLSTVGGMTFWGSHNHIILENQTLHGSWIREIDLVDSNYPFVGNEIKKDALAWKYGFEFVKDNFSYMPRLCIMKLWRLISPFHDTPNTMVFWSFAVSWIVTLPFVIFGLISLFRERNGTLFVLIIPILMTLMSVIVFYGSIRFRDFISPIFIIFAAIGLIRLMNRLFPSNARVCSLFLHKESSLA
jgi:4-amino-4-deoxy-L-arabinose transferase-like glycosyltransferase